MKFPCHKECPQLFVRPITQVIPQTIILSQKSIHQRSRQNSPNKQKKLSIWTWTFPCTSYILPSFQRTHLPWLHSEFEGFAAQWHSRPVDQRSGSLFVAAGCWCHFFLNKSGTKMPSLSDVLPTIKKTFHQKKQGIVSYNCKTSSQQETRHPSFTFNFLDLHQRNLRIDAVELIKTRPTTLGTTFWGTILFSSGKFLIRWFPPPKKKKGWRLFWGKI